MTLGSRTRRVASGFAAGAMLVLAGCHAMPVGRIAPSPNRPQSTLASASRAALLPATVAMDPPSEMSSIEPVAINPASITPAQDAGKPAPTPLLDAALLRANAVDEAGGGQARGRPEPATPVPSSEPPAPTPAPALIGSVEFPVMATAPTPAPSPTTPAVEPAGEAGSARPEEAWRDGVRKLAGLARGRLEQAPAGGSGSPSWPLRARVLAWLAEPDLDPELGHREADGVRAVLRALEDAGGESPRRGDEVRSAVVAHRGPGAARNHRPPLLRQGRRLWRLRDPRPADPQGGPAGRPLLRTRRTSVRAIGRRLPDPDRRTARNPPPGGRASAIHTRPLAVAEETCRRRRRDYYVAYKLLLPRPLEPGDYRLRLTSKDLNSDRSTDTRGRLRDREGLRASGKGVRNRLLAVDRSHDALQVNFASNRFLTPFPD